jgi:hypothetical protein
VKDGRSPRVACRSVEEGPVPREGVRPAVVRSAVCSSAEEGAAPVAPYAVAALAGRDVTTLASVRGATMTRVSRPPAAAPTSNVKERGREGAPGWGSMAGWRLHGSTGRSARRRSWCTRQRLGRGWGGERETYLALYHVGNPTRDLGMGVVLIGLS